MRRTIILVLSAFCGLALLPVDGFAEKAITVVDVKGHNEKPNITGYIEDMINGSGMSKPVPGLPSTWRAISDGYIDEWQSVGGALDSATSVNSKIGWAVFDLGANFSISNIYFWNRRQGGDPVEDYNVYYATTPTASVPDGPTDNTEVDYDFASGGWTKVNGSVLTMSTKGGTPDPAQAVIGLGGATARYLAIEVMTVPDGSASRIGLAEVGITEEDFTAPTLASTDIVDDRGGASIEANQFVTYTVTFDEDMATGTVSSADFDNAGTATISFDSVTPNTLTAQVWTVVVQPVSTGSLQLRVPSGATMTDISGNALGGLPIADDTTITVTPDVTDPTLASTNIVDDRAGAPVPAGNVVTYTITFSEDMDATTFTAADLSNAGSSSISIGSITEPTPGVFTVPVTPTTGGTLQLQVSASASVEDLATNYLDTTSAIADDTTITVDAIDPTLASSDIVDDMSGGPVKQYRMVTYTVTFSEDIDDTTVTSADFGNAGTATIAFGNVQETSAGVFAVQAHPTTTGTLQLRVNSGAVIEDVAGNTLDTSSAIPDDTTIAVSSPANQTLAPITDITAHQWGQNAPPGAGSIDTAIDGSGMTKGDALDPSTWVQDTAGWPDGWAGTSRLDPGSSINGKIGWLAFDLGSSTAGLQDLYLWNYRANGTQNGIKDYNIYYSESPTVGLPAPSSPSTDYDFASGGWTKFNPSIQMLLPIYTSSSPQRVVNLGGITARYVAIEIFSTHGSVTWMGLGEIGLTYQPAGAGTLFKFY